MRKQGWYKEYFAGAMQDMDEYEQGVAGIKRDLFSVVAPTDSVVDFGAGLAPNIKYLPPSVTVGDPNTHSSHNRMCSTLKICVHLLGGCAPSKTPHFQLCPSAESPRVSRQGM